MKKYFFMSLLILNIFCSLAFPCFGSAKEKSYELIEQKVGVIEHIYFLSLKFHHEKLPFCFYVLNDGFTISTPIEERQHWKAGESLVLHYPFMDDDEDEADLEVDNISRDEKFFFRRVGWASPCIHIIKEINFKKVGGDKVIVIKLDDNSTWKISYFDEKAEAKTWKVDERVKLFSQKNTDVNPFVEKGKPGSQWEMINLDSSKPFAGGKLKLINS